MLKPQYHNKKQSYGFALFVPRTAVCKHIFIKKRLRVNGQIIRIFSCIHISRLYAFIDKRVSVNSTPQ